MTAREDYIDRPFTEIATITRPADTTNYGSKDSISNSTSAPTAFEFDRVIDVPGAYMEIADVSVYIRSSSGTPTVNLYFFNSLPTATNDNATLNILDDDLINIETVVSMTSSFDYGDHFILHSTNLRDMIRTNTSNSKVYLLMQATSGFSPLSADVITVKVHGRFI